MVAGVVVVAVVVVVVPYHDKAGNGRLSAADWNVRTIVFWGGGSLIHVWDLRVCRNIVNDPLVVPNVSCQAVLVLIDISCGLSMAERENGFTVNV